MVLCHVLGLLDALLVLPHILEHGRHSAHGKDLSLNPIELLLLLLFLFVLQLVYYLVKVFHGRSA